MPKHNRWKYMVIGQGPFPIDMFRYDRCWPFSSKDSEEVIRIVSGSDNEHRVRGERCIEIGAIQVPEIDRWKSFGWAVVNVQGYRV